MGEWERYRGKGNEEESTDRLDGCSKKGQQDPQIKSEKHSRRDRAELKVQGHSEELVNYSYCRLVPGPAGLPSPHPICMTAI